MRLAPQELRTYFCTFSTAGRRRIFQVTRNAELMADTLQHYRAAGRFELHAYVVMPDHIHVVITPAPDVSLEKAIQFIRGGFSFRCKIRGDIWERGHFDKRIPNGDAYQKCVAYIDMNPVKANLCATSEEFLYSSCAYPEKIDPMPRWLREPEAKASFDGTAVTAG